MKNFKVLNFIFISLVLVFSFSAARAQDENVLQDVENQNSSPAARPNLLRELDLSAEQIRQIRSINSAHQPRMRQAKRRLQAANLALDEAVYADVADESQIQSLVREVQAAQGEVIRNRINTETAVRRILSPQQLSRFRQLRRQFNGRGGENRQNRRNGMPRRKNNFPLRRLGNRRQRQLQ